MRITSVEAIPITLPIPPGSYASESAGSKREWGRLQRVNPKRPEHILEYVLVRIETDEGVTGIGEAPADIGFFGQTVEQITAAINNYLGPLLLGHDPLDIERMMHIIDFRENSSAKSGIDLALHDLAGKAFGVSVGVLLGGRFRSRVKVAIEIAGGEPDDMAKACVRLMEQGVRAFKPKIGGFPDADADRLWAIRQAVGKDVSLRADANQGYSPKEAIALCRLCEERGVDLELLEQPVASHDLTGMAHVRASVETPIEADETVFSAQDAMAVVRHESADVLNIKIAKAGGFLGARRIVAIAEAAGLRCVLGTAFGLGVKVAAKLHLAASMATDDAVEFTELALHGNMLAPPDDESLALPLSDGRLPVPDGPGMGVEINMPV